MDYDEKELDIIPGDESGGDDVLARQLTEMSEQFVAIQHDLAVKDDQLALADYRIAELSAQIQALAEDALNWVPRAELDEKLALTEQYARAQYVNRHHSRNFQTLPEWLAALVPAE